MNALPTRYTPEEAGKRIGVTRGTVAAWIKRGLLKATNVGDGLQRPRWQIEQSDLEEAMESLKKLKQSDKSKQPKKLKKSKIIDIKASSQEKYIQELLEENRTLRKKIDELTVKNKQLIENILEVLVNSES